MRFGTTMTLRGTWPSSQRATCGNASAASSTSALAVSRGISSVARNLPFTWTAIVTFYEHLIHLSPTLGARIGHAAAVAEASGPQSGLALLDAIDHAAVSSYQPYWAVRAHLLQRLSNKDEAVDAFDRAIGLTEDPAVRRFLLERRRG